MLNQINISCKFESIFDFKIEPFKNPFNNFSTVEPAPVVVPHAGHEVAVRAAWFVGKFAEEFPEPSGFQHQTGYGKKMGQITGERFMICGLQLSGILDSPGLMRNWECQQKLAHRCKRVTCQQSTTKLCTSAWISLA